MKTFLPKVDEISRKWWVVDAEGVILGKLASKIADVLRGKNKPTFTPPPRHRRLCHCHQRREGQIDGQEGTAEDLPQA